MGKTAEKTTLFIEVHENELEAHSCPLTNRTDVSDTVNGVKGDRCRISDGTFRKLHYALVGQRVQIANKGSGAHEPPRITMIP